MFYAESVSKQAKHNSKWQDNDGINDRQNNARLKIANDMRNSLPTLPEPF